MLSGLKKNIKRTLVTILSKIPGASLSFMFAKGYTTLKQFAEQQKLQQATIWYKDVHQSEDFKRTKPVAIDKKTHWKFEDNAAGITKNSQATFCAEIAEARVYGKDGAVVTTNNLLVEDVSPQLGKVASAHSLLQLIKLQKPLHLRGRSFLLASTEGADNYFHWLTDALPKLEIAQKAEVDFNEVDYIIVNSVSNPFQKKAIQILGLDKFKIISLQESPYIFCDKLIVTSPTCLSGNISSWIIEFLRKCFSCLMIKDERFAGKNIYISRAHSTKRKLLNEEKLWQELSVIGFEKIFLEDLSFEDQVKVFYNAKTVMGVHGAGFTNLCFCNNETIVIELFPPTYVNQCYWNISNCLRLPYYYLIGEGADNTTIENHLIDNDLQLSTNQINFLKKFIYQKLDGTLLTK